MKPDPHAYIRNGYNPAVDTVPVDLRLLAAEDRDLVADYYEPAIRSVGFRVPVAAGTVEALLTSLRDRRRELEARQREIDRQRAELITQARDVFDKRSTRTEKKWLHLDGKAAAGFSYEVVVPDWPEDIDDESRGRGIVLGHGPNLSIADVVHKIGAAAWVAELAALNEERRLATRVNYDRQIAQEKAQLEAGTKILCAWALTREDARAIVENRAGKWVRKLEDLWIEAHAPAGYEALNRAMHFVPNNEPTQVDLEALKAAEAVCDGIVIADVQLGLVGGVRARPENLRKAVAVMVTAPTGYCCTFWRRIGSEQ
ncbi:hypothetical protein OHB26_09460 [Nocardia sp. NBC_01503]|uniref:hypothetical protein n=1 Tax=Nocardia sp. NBC_01503 TaxID=2975997 RepID=UPI002E7C1B8B|nr:hypothetical protein [Nocardia sp. NBC_01503]WTL34402.1 hypothetical protein OHB26_09460 [Nocardia sp. NBC_01503]